MDAQAILKTLTTDEKIRLLTGDGDWHTYGCNGKAPVIMMTDGPHGLRKVEAEKLGDVNASKPATCFPTASAVASSWNPETSKKMAQAIAGEARQEKISIVLGCGTNMKRSPLCGRNFEYYSEDPYLAGELATAHTKGLQSRNVGVSVKHFAANSQENRRMSTSAEVDERTLREIYFPAFEKVVRDGKAWTVMCSYNRINGVYSSENPWLLKTVLRDEWGFDGYVVSDWGAVNDRVKGVSAGLDLEMPSSGGSNDRRVMEAVKAGTLDEKDVDACVENILRIHTRYLENAKPETVWDLDAQHELAGKLAAECMVLLKNEDRVLPLKKTEKVAVIGKFAAVPRFQGGGSSHINCFRITSLMDELKDCSGVTYAQGYDTADEQPDETLIAEALRVAAEADKAVIVAGLPDSFESEGYDRTHLRMPLCQTELIRRVAEVNPNTIVVLYNGSPVEMPWLPFVKAVVEGYLGGQAVGTATANILYGKVNPCGRLPETLPVKLEDTPCFLSYEGEGDTGIYNEGIFVGYRYYDKKKTDVLFPFGYGLSYTKFEYSNLKLSSKEIRDTDILTVSVDVTNAGSVKGKEVVQLYVGDIESSVFRPVRELKEFGKIELEPGETKTVTFEIGKRAFAYWNTRLHDWHVETGDFRIEICSDSRTVLLSETVRVESTVQVPAHYTVNSIMADLIANPKAMEILRPIMQGGLFGSGENSGDSDAAGEAISDEMAKAMMMNMPLRSIASFSGGALTYDMIQKMVDQINNG